MITYIDCIEQIIFYIFKNLPDEIKNDLVQYPAADVYDRLEVFKDLGDDFIKIYDQFWTEIIAS